MKKIGKTTKKITSFFIAFLVTALVFLAVGFGTLGSFTTTGGDFALRAPVTDAEGTKQESTVVFRLDSSVTETYVGDDGREQTRSVSLEIDDVYLYVNAIYTEAGTPAGIRVRRSTSSNDYFSSAVTAELENLYTVPTPPPAEGEEESESEPTVAPQTDALYRWVHPMTFSTHSAISTYRYWELCATTATIRVAEVLFIGRPASTSQANFSQYIIPATVVSATPDTGETSEQARVAAEALLDAQPTSIPTAPVTSYDTFMRAEFYSLFTINEMRVGDRYTTDLNDRDANVYRAEGVYNVLGMDLLALGTEMFGITPFGLRFMPMLFSFGILVVGFFFVRRLFKSDRAGFVFALLYTLCDFSFALGHVGTPLTAGLFFLLLSVYCVDTFYRKRTKKPGIAFFAPLFFGGLSAAAAICVHGAMIVPVAAVCVLYVAGMIRQKKGNDYALEKAIAAYEAMPESEDAPKSKKDVAETLSQNRYRTLASAVTFPVALVLGTLVFSLLFILPVYSPLLKFYEGPASSTANVFSLGWKAFVGGFVGVNELGTTPSAWSLFLNLFTGAGESYAVTGVVMNAVAALCGLFGLAYAIYKLAVVFTHFGEKKKELRRLLPPVVLLVVALVAALVAPNALGFLFLAYLAAFMLAAYAADDCMKLEGRAGTAAKIVTVAALVLLVACFALAAVFTFSVPMPASFMAKFF